MFDRFTERAIKVIMLAQAECERLNHDYVGTEQILLGIIEVSGPAASLLSRHGVTLQLARQAVENRIGRGNGFSVDVPFTPAAKVLLEQSWKESQSRKHPFIDTEHLLLGLLRDHQGIAVEVLSTLKVDRELLAKEVGTYLDTVTA
jgi:ATP-dependent Clp protease ATP-binding subunit ClpC